MAELKLTRSNFEEEVLRSELPVLVDFWAVWCGPCRMLAPTVEELARTYEGRVKVGKVNVDEEEELAVRYRIASIPTLMLFRNGRVEQTLIGVQPKSALERMLNAL